VPNASKQPVPTRPRIVLASGSPRRRELLSGLGLAFEVRPADIDESVRGGEDPTTYVDRLAFEKARAVAARLVEEPRAAGDGAARLAASPRAPGSRPGAGSAAPLVIAADTVVIVAGEMLGKPRDAAENRAFVTALAGRTHQVSTGHCLLYGDWVERLVRTTRVTFRPLDGAEIDRYAATGEGLDKAGGYAIQGIGAALVDRIEGCYSNVVGLSVAAVVAAARRLGVALV
jgi:septum formation protein